MTDKELETLAIMLKEAMYELEQGRQVSAYKKLEEINSNIDCIRY